MSKGQIAMMDMVIAVGIFLVITFIIVLIWNNYSLKLSENLEYTMMQVKAFQISESLIKSPGIPTAWENGPNTIKVIGLAKRDRILSSGKVQSFSDLEYNNIRNLLKIDYYNYDFYFLLKDLGGGEIETIGKVPIGKYRINLQRRVLYEDEEGKKGAIMEFMLWK